MSSMHARNPPPLSPAVPGSRLLMSSKSGIDCRPMIAWSTGHWRQESEALGTGPLGHGGGSQGHGWEALAHKEQ